MLQDTLIVCQGFEKTNKFTSLIEALITSYNLEGSHLTFEKRNTTMYYGKISYRGKYIISDKDIDLDNLADKIILSLHKQINSYEQKKENGANNITFRKNKHSEDIHKVKKFIIKPTNLENALEHMKLLGHKFYIYIDIDKKPILLFEVNGEVFSQTKFEDSTLEEVIERLKLDNNLEYIAFNNIDVGELTIAYKRRTGNIGIIDASF